MKMVLYEHQLFLNSAALSHCSPNTMINDQYFHPLHHFYNKTFVYIHHAIVYLLNFFCFKQQTFVKGDYLRQKMMIMLPEKVLESNKACTHYMLACKQQTHSTGKLQLVCNLHTQPVAEIHGIQSIYQRQYHISISSTLLCYYYGINYGRKCCSNLA